MKNLSVRSSGVLVPALCLLLFSGGCSLLNDGESSSTVLSSKKEIKEDPSLKGGLGSLRAPVIADGEKLELGRALFFDSRLSKDGSVSCASCHHFDHGGADPRKFSAGVGGLLGDANAPSVFNSALNFRQFWDGRALNLFEQASGPIENPKEMASNWPDLLQKLQKDSSYQEKFKKIFSGSIKKENVIEALVAFEESLITLNSPFDRYFDGDLGALSEHQISGLKKFKSYGCIACHQGRNVGGNMFQTLGVAGDYFKDRGGSYPSDLGRFNVTKLERDRHVFRVPSLRNVELTAPYFHDGSVKTLEQAIRTMTRYQLGRQMPEEDVNEIASFLKALTGTIPSVTQSRGVANDKK